MKHNRSGRLGRSAGADFELRGHRVAWQRHRHPLAAAPFGPLTHDQLFVAKVAIEVESFPAGKPANRLGLVIGLVLAWTLPHYGSKTLDRLRHGRRSTSYFAMLQEQRQKNVCVVANFELEVP
ncbi:hypothetical protein GGX14DRAFT_404009 [Mycena pura]|uniref:Uncharacterized protein n=1 Tax=Mycena pura TaxID=153505 RepID=A0AAD6Y0I1_9AGAR|nr:hypothetical protein GGX14DRAFT_404009 [Mycena pura]